MNLHRFGADEIYLKILICRLLFHCSDSNSENLQKDRSLNPLYNQ